jgi:hypothetical protein
MIQYYNNTQEIDIEILSSEFDPANSSFPVNLVLQSRQAAEAGFDASASPTFEKVNLPFNPTSDFHEYRFDFLPGQVVFYADGQSLAEMECSAVPTHGGHVILQHWSNGNPQWSGGPPATDSTLTVQYVKAYFNSSAAQRQQDWQRRCTDPEAPRAVCAIPGVQGTSGSGNATTGPGFFFSAQANMTDNQTVSSDQPPAGPKQTTSSNGAGGLRMTAFGVGWTGTVAMAVLFGSASWAVGQW